MPPDAMNTVAFGPKASSIRANTRIAAIAPRYASENVRAAWVGGNPPSSRSTENHAENVM